MRGHKASSSRQFNRHWQSGDSGDWYRLPYSWNSLSFWGAKYNSKYYYCPAFWKENDAQQDGLLYYYKPGDVCNDDNLLKRIAVKIEPRSYETSEETGYYGVYIYLNKVNTENIIASYPLFTNSVSNKSEVPVRNAEWNDVATGNSGQDYTDEHVYITPDINDSIKLEIDRFSLHILKISKDEYEGNKFEKWEYGEVPNMFHWRWMKDGKEYDYENLALPPVDYKGEPFFRRMPKVHKSTVFFHGGTSPDLSGVNGIYTRYNEVTSPSKASQWQSGEKKEWDEDNYFGGRKDEGVDGGIYYSQYRPLEVGLGQGLGQNGDVYDLKDRLNIDVNSSYICTLWDKAFGEDSWYTLRRVETIDFAQKRMFIEQGVEI